jgi:EAL domain-containing protein (putative c-di-GMP-specific phosphodiesterase class I)
VTAEGIENDGHLGELRALGCDRGQGYHFARPIPGDRIPELLASAPWGRAQMAPVFVNGGAAH